MVAYLPALNPMTAAVSAAKISSPPISDTFSRTKVTPPPSSISDKILMFFFASSRLSILGTCTLCPAA